MNEKKTMPTKISLILRIAASAYLLYLAWGLKGAPANYTGGMKVLFIAAILVFAAVGLALGGTSLLKFIRGEYDMPEGSDSKES